MELGVTINKEAKVPRLHFTEVFKGFEKVEAVRKTLGESTESILKGLELEIYSGHGFGYMHVVDKNCLSADVDYIKTGREIDIYLDVVHELVHIRQALEGKELWDENFAYVDRPTEIEAYKVCTDEGRRLGLSDKDLAGYLKTDWVSEEDLARLLKSLNIKP